METEVISPSHILLVKKLISLKEQITFQSTISNAVSKEIDSIKLLLEAFLKHNESLNLSGESITQTNDSARLIIESLRQTNESMNLMDGAMNQMIGALIQNIEAMNIIDGATNKTNESTSLLIGAMNSNVGSLKAVTDAKNNSAGATVSKEQLSKLIIKSASEKLKLSFYFDNIPNRLAAILIAMNESKKLHVAEMQKLTGASRNSITRDLGILKKLEWIKFFGGRSNGYFSLTEEGEKALKETDHK